MQNLLQSFKSGASLFFSILAGFLILFAGQVVWGIFPLVNLILFLIQGIIAYVWWQIPREFKFKGIYLGIFLVILSSVLADIVVGLFYLGAGKEIFRIIQGLF